MKSPVKFNWVYVTASSISEARDIAKKIIEEDLAACANIIDGMTSIYKWKGKLEEGNETVIIIKTRNDLLQKLVQAIKLSHSSECPCILALPVADGNPNFLEWVFKNTDAQIM